MLRPFALGAKSWARQQREADDLLALNALYHRKLDDICRLSLGQWTALAKSLGVALNDREQAAKKLAIREMRAGSP